MPALSSAAAPRYTVGGRLPLVRDDKTMRSKVTEQGVILPRQWFQGVDEVEIRREDDRVVVLPFRGDDPITRLGKQPITDDLDDASVNHDRYLYDG